MKKRPDWALLALYFAKEKGLSPAQLQKSIFLLQKAFPKASKLNYDFQPYNYGPFDASVYHDVELLADLGLAEINEKDGYSWCTYKISPAGIKAAKPVIKMLNKKIKTYFIKLMSWIQAVSFQQLIASIYKKYPEYKEKSIFRG